MSLKWLPNALTIARCGLAVVVGWFILEFGRTDQLVLNNAWLPFGVFVLVAATDFLDGYAARKLDAASAFGAFLDPLADKLLIAVCLLAISSLAGWSWLLLGPTLAIVIRDVYVTMIRLRPTVSLPVTRLAKWKTAFEMIGVGGYLLGFPLPLALLETASITLIYLAAGLSLYTGLLYLRASSAPPRP